MASNGQLLRFSVEELGLAFDEEQYRMISTYIGELELWNPTYKLVGARGAELVTRHIVDSLAAVPVLTRLIASRPGTVVADLGSGAGLPGIPLAIAMPSIRFVLVERMGRRVGFLRNAIALCRLGDRVEVCEQDLSEVKQTFDMVTFRAFRPLPEILDMVEPLLAPHGVVCAYKAQMDSLQAELEQVRQHCKSQWTVETVPLHVPNLEAERMLCILHRRDT
jgi:16S rRNA (guanine527-N7)-methyltransferase